ncbi:cell surface lipoprotein MPT83 [Mycobacterium lentiflavum]|uniref:Cell surface lipoprotein MPT83 n=1 Tax=Mycobacterium lentiflavum TaxID=141349 RepID=A0A0E4CML1_MYCLN|nr:fasciclin domain-containing protein [Mycobacterium lentiflavum]MEE3066248.1 fasciclin domain-containing protein [Actinomycetota bacterium]ULP44078.1 fasciclin domain-containing protein [Mycobacterium lentiflavum]CQD10820.1 cell surface lipoprotein MPT83 [Mycobacterium lentiflavum]
MMNDRVRALAAAGLAAVAIVGFSGCSSNKPAAQGTTSTSAAPATSMATSATTTATADPAADLVGSGCSAYAAQNPTGPGSVAGMAQDPVATAASNNPMLTTLTSALSGKLNPNVNLVDTLNNGQYTVFAPTNAAFDKLPAATVDKLKTDAALLKSILTYHVVPGQLSPAKVDGAHATLQGANATVTGQGNDIKVNDASVVCGGVHTANATVYMIDSVLMPPTS